MPRLLQSQGFTAVELAFVLALLATFASLGFPNLSDSREKSNEAHAVKDLKAVAAAESRYHDAYGVFANSLQQLAAAGLIDDILGSGQDDGYDFEVSARGKSWIAAAAPHKIGDQGWNFYEEEAGDFIFSCPPGYHLVSPPTVFRARCVPNIASNQPVVKASSTESPSVVAAAALDRLSGATALPAAKRLTADEVFMSAAITALDGNRDGSVTFDELLSADLLGIARSLRTSGPIVPIGVPDAVLGDDRAVRDITAAYLRATSAELQLGVAHESEPPAVPLAGLRGYPDAFLELVP